MSAYHDIAELLRDKLLNSIDSYFNYAYKRGVMDAIALIEAEGEKIHEHHEQVSPE